MPTPGRLQLTDAWAPPETYLTIVHVRTYDTYVPNKTISVPDDVVPIIDDLGMPFSTWVADQLRRYAASQTEMTLGQELLADAVLADAVLNDGARPTDAESRATLEQMERSAPW